MNPLQQLERLGQSVWYDNISRGILQSGELERMVRNGILGVTSNPTIFDKAISGSTDYDDQLRGLLERDPAMSAAEIIKALMITDIQMAADVLRPVYERSAGRDGYISVEVSPHRARDTEGTVIEARELWTTIGRPNLMIKIPATDEGLRAIARAINEGININVTLIFSVERYRQVTDAYLAGLEQRIRSRNPVDQIASVASLFVSRVDTLVDELLQKRIAATADEAPASRLRALQGKAAVANARLVYQTFKEIFHGPRFAALRAKGARVQRPLWGSTGTKNPAYSDLLYVEPLVGPDTVNTVPPQTLDAIVDHLKPSLTIEQDGAGARATIDQLVREGIDMTWVMKKLEDDGVAAFARSFDALAANLQAKRGVLAPRMARKS